MLQLYALTNTNQTLMRFGHAVFLLRHHTLDRLPTKAKELCLPWFCDQSEPSPRLIYHLRLMGSAHPEQWLFEGAIHLPFTPFPVSSKTALPQEGQELGCTARGFILCRSLRYFLTKGCSTPFITSTIAAFEAKYSNQKIILPKI